MSIGLENLLGKPCPRGEVCGGTLKSLNSIPTPDGRSIVRYYGCNACGCRPEDNKRVIPIEYSSRRAV